MRWMIGATKNATSYWHADAAGYGTFVHLWTGAKLWMISVQDSSIPGMEGMTDRYTLRDFSVNGNFQAIPLLMLPGDSLYAPLIKSTSRTILTF